MIDELKTDYKDDILATGQQGRRTFNIIDKNGNMLYEDVHIEDASEYLQVGDEYGGDIINEQNESINSMDDKLDELIEFMDNGVKAEDVTYNDSNVKLALDTLGTRINGKLDKTGESTNNTISYTSNDNSSIFNSGNLGGQSTYAWSTVAKISTGEKHSSLLNKVSAMFKNIRTIAKLIGTTDISSIGNGTLSGGISQLNIDLNDVKDTNVILLTVPAGTVWSDACEQLHVAIDNAYNNGNGVDRSKFVIEYGNTIFRLSKCAKTNPTQIVFEGCTEKHVFASLALKKTAISGDGYETIQYDITNNTWSHTTVALTDNTISDLILMY